MATTKFNANIIEAARRLKSARTSAGPSEDSTKKYSSALLTQYENRAVRDLLKELYEALGDKGFGDVVPEYIATSPALTLASGIVAKPADAWHITDLLKSDRTVKFHKIPSLEVENVRSGQDGLIVPSATRPVFWEEGPNIYTLGLTTGDVIARYVKTHQDITVITDAAGNGTIYTTAANLTWTAATKTVAIAAISIFSSADVNKLLIFRTSSIVYIGTIQSVTEVGGTTTNLVLSGDGLPAGNIAAPNIIELVMSDVGPGATDLKLADNHFGNIIDRMVAFGLADAKAGIV